MRYNGFLGGKVLSSWKQSIWIPKAPINTFHCAKHANAKGVWPWGHAHQKNFEKRNSEVESEAILESKYMHVI